MPQFAATEKYFGRTSAPSSIPAIPSHRRCCFWPYFPLCCLYLALRWPLPVVPARSVHLSGRQGTCHFLHFPWHQPRFLWHPRGSVPAFMPATLGTHRWPPAADWPPISIRLPLPSPAIINPNHPPSWTEGRQGGAICGRGPLSRHYSADCYLPSRRRGQLVDTSQHPHLAPTFCPQRKKHFCPRKSSNLELWVQLHVMIPQWSLRKHKQHNWSAYCP